MNFEACGKTDKGLRRSNNEDNFAVARDLALFLVADGMGGHAAGEVASKMAIDVILEHIKRSHTVKDPIIGGYDNALSDNANRLRSSIKLANQVILEAARENSAWYGMGTTLVAAWQPDLNDPSLLIANVGDSRIYLVRNKKIKRLTEDHSIVEEQVKQGLISRKEADESSVKNMITRALGHYDEVNVDLARIRLRQNDKIILCTDGLSGMLKDERILALINQQRSVKNMCGTLIDAANDAGGKDNIAVILAHFTEPGSRDPSQNT